jgi:hypothetical protein
LCNLRSQGQSSLIKHRPGIAGVAARYIHEINKMAMMQGYSLGQLYIKLKGLKLFGSRGKEAGYKQVGQPHERKCVDPILVSCDWKLPAQSPGRVCFASVCSILCSHFHFGPVAFQITPLVAYQIFHRCLISKCLVSAWGSLFRYTPPAEIRKTVFAAVYLTT